MRSWSVLNRRQALRLGLGAFAAFRGVGASEKVGVGPGDVPWLWQVQKVPTYVPGVNGGQLHPVLRFASGEEVSGLEAWRRRRMELRAAWMDFLGPMPAQRPPVNLEILSEDAPRGCQRQLVRYESEPGLFVEGFLLRPAGKNAALLKGKSGKLPAIVGFHQTTSLSIEEIAGLRGRESMQIGLKLCRRGFIVFCPRCFLWQGTVDIQKAASDFLKRRPGTLGMHKMLYDAMRGVDVVASLPEVDPGRIGAAGHSLGAKEVLYLAAFDERVQAAVASEGGVGFNSTNWSDPWYLGPGINSGDFPLNHHQLIALTAPRALLLLGGERGGGAVDGIRTWPYVKAALPAYRLYRSPPRLGLFIHRKGHSLPAVAFRRMAEWLETYTAE